MTAQLRQLVKRFLTNRISLGQFQRELVTGLLVPSNGDGRARELYRNIESLLVAHDVQAISVVVLRAELAKLAAGPPIMAGT